MTFEKWLSTKDEPNRTAAISINAEVYRSDWASPQFVSIREEVLKELKEIPEFKRLSPEDRAAQLADRRILQAELYPLDRHRDV